MGTTGSTEISVCSGVMSLNSFRLGHIRTNGEPGVAITAFGAAVLMMMMLNTLHTAILLDSRHDQSIWWGDGSMNELVE